MLETQAFDPRCVVVREVPDLDAVEITGFLRIEDARPDAIAAWNALEASCVLEQTPIADIYAVPTLMASGPEVERVEAALRYFAAAAAEVGAYLGCEVGVASREGCVREDADGCGPTASDGVSSDGCE